MNDRFREHLARQLTDIRSAGLYKGERVITSPQDARIEVAGQPRPVVNMCANNYLGLAEHPAVIQAAHDALDRWGYGLASVRFICGTQQIHKQLEQRLSEFLGTDDTILYSSCFDANGGLFETILGAEDAVISDELNHASIIDGVRLCKAQRLRYKNGDLADLALQLDAAKNARFRLIATDGVFSMDGYLANLPGICELADQHDALVMVDDSHAVGFIGPRGRGTHEHHGVMDRIDILTGTLGKALGGASGGYTSGRTEIIELLRQRSRPYLFSNTLAPPIVAGSLQSLELLTASTELRDTLEQNTRFFRERISQLGYDVLPGIHPIAPLMLYDAALAARVADELLQRGVYVIGFSYPVVPQGRARIRTQISAAHTRDDLEFALEQFAAVQSLLKQYSDKLLLQSTLAASRPRTDDTMNESDRAAAHRQFSGECFNRVWELMENTNRSPADDEQMLFAAMASLWHWTQRADCTDQNLSIGYWQLSRVYSLLGQAENARRFGDACLKHSRDLAPFFLGYAHEALARAAMLAADKALLDAHAAAARTLAAGVTERDDRLMLEADLEQLRLP